MSNDGVRGAQHASDDIGDFIRRSTVPLGVLFRNNVDDALMGITLVVRGEDHSDQHPRQLLSLRRFALPKPGYAHIALVVRAMAPLSKRTGSKSGAGLRARRANLPGAVNNYSVWGISFKDKLFRL